MKNYYHLPDGLASARNSDQQVHYVLEDENATEKKCMSEDDNSERLTVPGQACEHDHHALLVGTQDAVLRRPLLSVPHLDHARWL